MSNANELPSIQAAIRRIENMRWEQQKAELYQKERGDHGVLWFKAQVYFPIIMTLNEARLLDFLANWQTTFGQNKKWFFCRRQELAYWGFMSPAVQTRAFAGLARRRFIATEMRGRKARRYICIRYRAIIMKSIMAFTRWERKVKRWANMYNWKPAAGLIGNSDPGAQWVSYGENESHRLLTPSVARSRDSKSSANGTH